MNLDNPLAKRANALYPYFLFLLGLAGPVFTVAIGRTDLLLFSLTLVVPLLLASAILLSNKGQSRGEIELPVFGGRSLFFHLVLLETLVFLITISLLLHSSTRPVAYFVAMSLCIGLVLLQISCRRPDWTDGLIVAEVLLLSLDIIWGMTLKYPLYFGDTDILGHLRLIDSVLRTAHVGQVFADYLTYPLYHLYIAAGIEVTDVSIRTGLFVLMGLAWQFGMLFAFLIFRELVKSRRFALVGLLLFASSSQIIFYGAYAIARSLALVLIIFWVFLLLKAQRSARYLLLLLIVTAATVMTHHANVVYFIAVLALIYVCELALGRFRRSEMHSPLFVYLFAASTISYLVFVASGMSTVQLPQMLVQIFNSRLELNPNPTGGYGPPIIFSIVYFSFVLLMCLLAIRTIYFYLKSAGSTGIAGAFALAGFLLLVFYVPGPLDLLPVAKLALTARVQLMVSLLVLFCAAFGLRGLWAIRRPLPYAFVICMSFFSLISVDNALDVGYLPNTSTNKTPYFTTSELTSFAFLDAKANASATLYCDGQTYVDRFSLSKFESRFFLEDGDINYIQQGLIILRTGELRRKSALTFSRDGYGVTTYRYRPSSPSDMQPSILESVSLEDNIYSNADVEVYAVHK